MGSHVAGLRPPEGHAPTWNMVLTYEAELRKAAYRFVREGVESDLGKALFRACNAPDIRSTYFIAPFILVGADRASMESPPAPHPFTLSLPEQREGEGHKGKVLRKTIGKARLNAQGKNICFPYNRKSGCQRKDCKFAHICQRCFEKHPYFKCRQVKRPADADV